MPLLKAGKQTLAKRYGEDIAWAKNAVLLSQSAIPVNEINNVRQGIAEAEGKLEIIKKRVFLKGVQDSYEGATIEDLQGSVAVLYSYNESDEHAPLKVINNFRKQWKKDKLECTLEYIGGWYDKARQDASYVWELAALPSKEELIGKFLFMLNHPVSSFARVVKAIADKDGEVVEEAVVEEPKAEEQKTEEAPEATPVVEEKSEEASEQAEEQQAQE